MALVVTISGSPATLSRTAQIAEYVGRRLAADGFEIHALNVRDLPAEDLLHARGESPTLKESLAAVERADGVVVATPVYKAAYSGLLKAFLDLLPQFALAGKTVLPLATGGTLAHVLAVDYGLRPVLHALGAQHVTQGLFLLDKLITRDQGGVLEIDPDLRARLDLAVGDFARSTRLHRTKGP